MTYYVNNELAMPSLFKSFMWTWEDKKHIILAVFFFTIFHEMEPSKSQSIPKYCVCIFTIDTERQPSNFFDPFTIYISYETLVY